MYTLSFVTPSHISLDNVEEHLYENGTIKLIAVNVNYQYVTGSAKLVGGRKFKNES